MASSATIGAGPIEAAWLGVRTKVGEIESLSDLQNLGGGEFRVLSGDFDTIVPIGRFLIPIINWPTAD